jgi:hypothetical protein
MARGELPAALVAADKAVQAQPQDANLRFLRGVVLMDLRRDEEAALQFTTLTHEYPELPDPYNNLAFACAPAGLSWRGKHCKAPCSTTRSTARRASIWPGPFAAGRQAWGQAASASPADLALQRKLQALRTLLASDALPGTAASAAR